jgi:predicted Zn-dependent protease
VNSLPAEDFHHLQAAEGWLLLGNRLEANEELEKITPQFRAHPAVLLLRWNVCAEDKKWQECVELAQALINLAPDQEQGWVNLGNSLYFCGRTQEAYDCVKPLLDRFPRNPTLRYNLACYACQL